MPLLRTAVLIHGCHLQADLNGSSWEDIVWAHDEGREPTLEGRATMGLKAAVDYEAEVLIFSTGASERDGVKEGEYTFNRAIALNDRSNALAHRTGFIDQNSFYTWLENHHELDLVSQNTAEECFRNFRLCAERGIKRVILVSSPWHIQRCHTEALKVAQTMRDNGETVPEIVAIASHGSTEGAVILEPPHRGDMPKTVWHELGRRFFKVPADKLRSFEGKLSGLFDEYGA